MDRRARLPPLSLLVAAVFGLALGLLLGGCSEPPPFAQLSGLILDPHLDEISGLAASRAHPDTLWALDDGGNAAALYAIGDRGGLQATVRVDGVANTDWEDLAAFDLHGRHYLLIADTGDNGGLRRTLQLHVVEEPRALVDGHVRPAWSIVFRWPDGPRDCEAVAVDAARGQILLISKRRQPPELFVLPLQPGDGLQVAQPAGHLAGVPRPDAADLRSDPRQARIRHQVTAADLSPDGRQLAVLTYSEVLIYRRTRNQSWPQALATPPSEHDLPWLPQAEALAWSADGRGLYATGEHSPAPLLALNP
jgi:hypothetical protein